MERPSVCPHSLERHPTILTKKTNVFLFLSTQIDPKRAIPREEHLRNTRYFVGGLAPQSTADSMRAFFSKFGTVVDATVMVDRETGRSKGFGFVTFEDNSNDSQLVGKLGLILDDKQVRRTSYITICRSLFLSLLRLKSRRPNRGANVTSNETMQPLKTTSTTVKLRQATPRRWALVCHLCR